MNIQDLLEDAYSRVYEFMKHVLSDLGRDDLDWQPKSDANSIGWLSWHLTRQHDAQVATLMNMKQLWITGKWHERFGRPADPEDTGFGHTEAQIRAFKSPDAETFLKYQRAVAARSIEYFKTLSEEGMDTKLEEPWFQPLPTVGIRIISIMEDSMLHAGQMGYVRGLLKGKGWQDY